MKFTDDLKSKTFEIMPAGKTVLKVESFKPITQMGKVKQYKAVFVDSKGRKVFNSYEANPKAKNYKPSMRALYSLLKTGCGLEEGPDGEIDEMQCVGRYLIANIKHVEAADGRIFVNLGYIDGHVDGFPEKENKPENEAPFVEDEDDDDPYA